MRPFLLKLTLISFLGYWSCWGIDYLITKGIQNSDYEDITTWSKVLAGDLEEEIVILGSSRAYRHIDPFYLEGNLNMPAIILGNSDAKIDFSTFALELFLLKNPKPKLILWVLDFDSFEQSNEIQDYQKFLPFVNEGLVKDFLINNKLISEMELILPLARYAHWTRLKWEGLYFGNSQSEKWTKGFYPVTASWDQKLDDKFRQNFNSVDFIFNEKSVDFFKNYLKKLTSMNVKVVLILPPYLLKGSKQYKNQDQILTRINLLAESEQAYFLDYGTNTRINSEAYFYDFYHMNLEGVNLFNQLLADDLKQIISIQNFAKSNPN
jgi:hypothetical protein